MKAKRTAPAVPVKKFRFAGLFSAFLFLGNFTAVFSGCAASGGFMEAGYTPGVYEGSGRGYRGAVHVRVQISPAGIEDIVITAHNETVNPGLAAMELLLDGVLETGSTDLDVVSGATRSSTGFLEAVEDALEKAASS